jgi:hypothetical protein
MTPTASKLNLVLRCQAMLSLPCVEGTSSEAASVGTEVHAWLEAKLAREQGREVELPELSAHAANMRPVKAYDWLQDMMREHDVSMSQVRSEVKVAACLPSACELDSTDARDYSQTPDGWIAGTADVVVDGGAEGWIIDWKTTSSHTGVSRSAGSADTNSQIAWLGHAFALLYGWSTIHCGLVHIGPNGDLKPQWKTYSRFELELAASEIWQAVSAADTRPKPGSHCHALYCPAIASCPAHAAITKATGLQDEGFPIPRSAAEIQSDQHALWLYAAAKATESASVRLRMMAEDYARAHNGQARHGNHVLRVSTGSRETIKGGNVGRLVELLDKYAPGKSAEMVTCSVSKGDIEAAIKSACDKGQGARIVRECLAELKEAGYLSRSEFETFKFEEEK